MQTQLWAFALLRDEHLMSFALAFRWTEPGAFAHAVGVPGLFAYYEIRASLDVPQQESALHSVKHEDGARTVDGFHPPEWPRKQQHPCSLERGVDREDARV